MKVEVEQKKIGQEENDSVKVFLEKEWGQQVKEECRIAFRIIELNQEEIDFLTDDQTNPNILLFSLAKHIQEQIKDLGGKVFAKFANRSPKDCPNISKQIRSVHDLVMLVKMSQYLTQGLCEAKQSQIILKKYLPILQNGQNQFRVYILNNKIVGLCQKQPCFFSDQPTINQITAIKTTCLQLFLHLFDKQNIKQCVMDIFCSANGSELYIMNIQPFHINSLSLFTEQELRLHASKNKEKILIRVVLQEKDLKDIDLSEYRVGAELKNMNNIKEWVQFMQISNKDE